MSFSKSSALRWFEDLLEKTRAKLKTTSRHLSISSILEKVVGLGDVVFPKIVELAQFFARILNKLQLTMIESMIMASIWSGLILLALIILVVYTTR